MQNGSQSPFSASIVPDLLFDWSRLLEYAKIRTVLQSTRSTACFANRRRVVQERARIRIETSSQIIVPWWLLTLIITFQTFLTCGVRLHVVSKNGLVPALFFYKFPLQKWHLQGTSAFFLSVSFCFRFFLPTDSEYMAHADCIAFSTKLEAYTEGNTADQREHWELAYVSNSSGRLYHIVEHWKRLQNILPLLFTSTGREKSLIIEVKSRCCCLFESFK